MNNYILITIILIFILLGTYRYISRSIEPFESTSTRACTVWFTDYKKECDEGLFHKDLRSIEFLRNETLSSLDKEIASVRRKLESNNNIITNYKGMTILAIERKIEADSTNYINVEKQKGLERNQLQIEIEENKLKNKQRLARQYYYSIPTLEREVIRLNNTLTTLTARLVNVKRGEDFKKLNNVFSVKQKDPNFRCKNEYLGWDELNSAGNANLNDYVKSTTAESQFRGHPYTWAFCHKTNATAAAKTKIDSHLENMKYQSVTQYDAGISPLTSSIRFNKFDPQDKMECDDLLVTPYRPSIPNGLLEIKIAPNNIVTSMKVIRYKERETRFIDTNTTKNLSDINLDRLMLLFYDFIINLERDTYQFYIYPKTSLTYRVYNLYYDNKCQRFFGDTKKPLGVSKAGDLFGKTYPFILIDKVYERDAIKKQRIPFPSREYINPNTMNSKLLNTIITNIQTSLKTNQNILAEDRRLLADATRLKQFYEFAWRNAPTCAGYWQHRDVRDTCHNNCPGRR